MPWQKFEALYAAHIKRDSVTSLTDLRNAQISGIWANTNLDPQKQGENPRGEILEKVYENYVISVKKVYDQYEEKKESEINWDDPFFKAMKVPSNPYYVAENSPLPHDQNLNKEIDQK